LRHVGQDVCMYMHVQGVCVYIRMCVNTLCILIYTHMCIHTYICTCIYVHVYIKYTHTHTRTLSLSLSLSHTHTHTHTNTNIHTHTHVPDRQSKQQNPIRYSLSATHCSTLQHPATHCISSDCTSLLHITVGPIIINTTYRTQLHTHSRSSALTPVAGLNLLR